MIREIFGDIFASPADTIVNPVNCVGVMGAGLAKQCRDRYPEMYRSYKRLCLEGKIRPGVLWLSRGTPNVLCFPTKNNWRERSELTYVGAGLAKLAAHHERLGIQSLAMPRLGCGLGGLSWGDVRPLIYEHLSFSNLDVTIYHR